MFGFAHNDTEMGLLQLLKMKPISSTISVPPKATLAKIQITRTSWRTLIYRRLYIGVTATVFFLNGKTCRLYSGKNPIYSKPLNEIALRPDAHKHVFVELTI